MARPDLFPDRPISAEELRIFTRRAMDLRTFLVQHTEQRTVRRVEQHDMVYVVEAADEDEARDLVRKGEYQAREDYAWDWVDEDEDDAEVIEESVKEVQERP